MRMLQDRPVVLLAEVWICRPPSCQRQTQHRQQKHMPVRLKIKYATQEFGPRETGGGSERLRHQHMSDHPNFCPITVKSGGPITNGASPQTRPFPIN